ARSGLVLWHEWRNRTPGFVAQPKKSAHHPLPYPVQEAESGFANINQLSDWVLSLVNHFSPDI
ncbi:MAG: hypothetical protein ACFCUR_16885, partial [Rhodomicrobiaceae bacterium]